MLHMPKWYSAKMDSCLLKCIYPHAKTCTVPWPFLWGFLFFEINMVKSQWLQIPTNRKRVATVNPLSYATLILATFSHVRTFDFGTGHISLLTHVHVSAIWLNSELTYYNELHQTGGPSQRASWPENKLRLHTGRRYKTINRILHIASVQKIYVCLQAVFRLILGMSI